MAPPADASHEPQAPETTKKSLVLIADDDRSTRGMLAEILRLSGFDALEASDGQEALNLAFDQQPDVIILDVVMPVLGGIDAARTITQDRIIGGTPIIAISGFIGADMQKAALEAGCSAYLQKPFTPPTLIAEVRRWAGKRTR